MVQANIECIVTLEVAKREELASLKKDMQTAFTAAVIETFGSDLDGPIPSDKDIEESFHATGAVIYHILANGKKVGGVVLTIDEITQNNSLDLFFISVNEHSRGIGLKAWQAIEEKYPKTKVWETYTPYFEKRNIHFYVNKCGFQIVEYFNKHHLDCHKSINGEVPIKEDFFRFKKIIM
ncbi:GNAT family N-acetyltransferase [Pelosinus sp. sgz500959]|uniref:GNAT family N-acetyltransferase n=1 Tax=Pelosinus sp. sgz500959 TaxID=3242472 RepID=UPI00366A876B